MKSEIEGVAVVNGLKYLVHEIRDVETMTKAGIVIPQTAKEDHAKWGRIAAVGDGAYIDGKFHGPKYAIGQLVYFDRYTAKIPIHGVDYRLVPEDLVTFAVTPGSHLEAFARQGVQAADVTDVIMKQGL